VRSLVHVPRLVALSVCVLLATTVMAPSAFAQTVIPLYNGGAPGSPQLADQEKQYFSKAWNTEVVTNVSRPTLTVYKPTGGVNSGSAVIICPGGGFMALSIENEGNQAATYLAARGMTAFVLRYRLVPTQGDATEDFGRLLQNDRARFDQMVAKAVPIAIADGMAAVAYVRQHAAEYGVAPDRVGIMGFSAGGGVTTGVAFQYKPESRPAFLGFIYPGGQEFGDATVPADAPPMFIAAASDDMLSLPTVSIALYQKWITARAPAEIHMYARGGHGFGMRARNIPTDHWIDRFVDWLGLQGFLRK
jgi:acetyl esterase/lipase